MSARGSSPLAGAALPSIVNGSAKSMPDRVHRQRADAGRRLHAGQRADAADRCPCRSACDRGRSGISTAAGRSARRGDCPARSRATTRISCAKLRVIRPAPTSSISASATSTTTSALSSRAARTAASRPRRRSSCRASPARDACSAGTRPNTSATHDRDRQREEQHAAVEAHILHPRQAAFRQRVHEPDAGPRDEQAERAADRRQHESSRPAPDARAARVRRRAPRAPRFRRGGWRAAPASGSRRWRRRSAAGSRRPPEISSERGPDGRDELFLRRDHARAPPGVAVG